MLHLILGILKVIGIILLVMVALLLLGILALLFVPLRYQLAGKKTEEVLEGHAKVSWLLHLIGMTVEYSQKKLGIRLKLFGFTIKRFGGEHRSDKPHADKRRPGQKKEGNEKLPSGGETEETNNTAQPDAEQKAKNAAQTGADEETENAAQPDAEQEADTGNSGRKKLRVTDFSEKLSDWMGGGESRIEKLKKKKNEVLRKAEPFLRDSSRELFHRILVHLKGLWKHYRPRKLQGWVRYGAGSPDVTGELTGVLYLLMPASGDKLELRPDFTETVFETDAGLRGHIRAFWLVKAAVSLWMDREFRRMVKIVRGRSGNKKGGQ